MSAQLFQIYAPPAPPLVDLAAAAPPPAFERPVLTYSMFEVARHLGCNGRSANWVKNYLGQLQEEARFPAPLPTLVKGKLTSEIVPGKSRWVAQYVHAWLGKLASADIAGHIEDEQARAAASRMDMSADNLFPGRA